MMPSRPFFVLVLSLCSLTVRPALTAESQQGDKPPLDTFVREYAAVHHFSGTLHVEEDGRTLYRGSFGLADRAFQVPWPLTPSSRLPSITKAFTSVLVLQLAEEGKIDLDAPIKTYLTNYVGEGADTVTIHHLLNHTSGLPNADAGIRGVRDALARHSALPIARHAR